MSKQLGEFVSEWVWDWVNVKLCGSKRVSGSVNA